MTSGPSDASQLHGRFRIATELARGGMGTVYSALDVSTGRQVALKRLMAGASARLAALFEREYYVLSTLRHPHIIEVYEYGIDALGPFYTMELLQGADLRERAPLSVAETCRCLRDIASSLALLHARRLLHRDISPRNVRGLPGGGYKLLDFGALTTFGTTEELVGTTPAIPPEALAGQALDQRSDLYALGALAYFVLTGGHAYPALTLGHLPDAWAVKPAAPSRYAPEVPRELDQLVLSLLSLDPLARPASAAEVIERLHALAGLEREADPQIAQAYFAGTTLVERAKPLERVQQCVTAAHTGRGSSIFVEGKQGVGKTRFLAEVSLKAQLGGITVLRVAAREHVGPFATARALVQQALRVAPRAAHKAFAAHASTLRRAWGESFGATPALSLAGAPTPSLLEATATLPAALLAAFHELADKATLVIAVDDVDHADPESTALLLTLAREARERRIVLVTTADVRADDAWTLALRGMREVGGTIRLRELTPEGTLDMVRAAFGEVPQLPRTARKVYGATHGNPEHCMRLLQHWVASGLIQYGGGAWTLPLELPESALRSSALRDRVLSGSPAVLAVAGTLAVLDRPVSLDECLAIELPHLSSREVIAALDELVQAELVVASGHGYRFRHESLRGSVLEQLAVETRRALHHRIGHYLLATGDRAYEAQLEAGLHLIRGGDELRGATLIARAARVALAADHAPAQLVRGVPALEAALEVYRAQGRTTLEQLDLLVPLVISSYEISIAFALRHADPTLTALEAALGITGVRARATLPDASELIALLGAAPCLEAGELPSEHTPDVLTLLGWLAHCVLLLTAVSSAAIDHETEARIADVLRAFSVFGPTHPLATAYDICRLTIGMTEDHMAASHAGWSEILTRIDQVGFAPNVARSLRLLALASLGILESQRDDGVVLARAQQIEQVDVPQSGAIANQIRFLYHGFRGEVELAQSYRERVEAYAVQFGSAWQVEIWSTCTLSAVYGVTRDAAGNQRVVEQLQRLKVSAPSLEPYWERAVATQHSLTGAHARAIEGYERTLARSGPRERVGWTMVRTALARAHNQLGHHALARQLSEETLALSEADLEYVTSTLGARVELIRALSGLGELSEAKQRLAQLFERHRQSRSPTTLGVLHQVAAEIALHEADALEFERQVDAMQACYQPTRNPALIAQCDMLRTAAASGGAGGELRAGDLGANTSRSVMASMLARCHGPQERARRTLELVAFQAGVQEAHLFTRGANDQPKLIGTVGSAGPTADVTQRVCALFEEMPEDADETAFVPNSEAVTSAEGFRVDPHHRLLALTVQQRGQRLLVGAIALGVSVKPRPVTQAVLHELAQQLFQAGDLTSVRRMDRADETKLTRPS